MLGPEEFGWSGYFYSGYDLWYGSTYGWGTTPDRTTNGGWDYMPWLLNQFYQRATNTNQRLLDYFTLHCYPEDGNVAGRRRRHHHPATAQPADAEVLGHELRR